MGMIKTGDIVRANIREFRLRSGKGKRELCESIGMSRTFWDDVESGAKEPSISTVERIAKALGITVADLLTEPRKTAKRELVGGRK